MRRVQIQLDDRMYEALRRRAFQHHESLAATIRGLLQEKLHPPRRRRRWRLEDFPWIGSFSREDPYPVSEEHDRALGEIEW